ncbi:alpha/beta fold hydrolase [Providencia rettgeri]|jgi:pimeloyl-ACP methyl ester carboxylesterase|uniref:alpha/beta fold hydrolase n=1 Tax=Providencia rettgeri TaxID=587 RepID=UPI0023619132|nr:alpha/beta hydrolase [Providencia rettgeri]ELR5152375.1 alpha/beta hydrolase [Providencia rettgeri]MDR2226783.1 alpha/beta hydrolase [Providencia sp.]
MYNAPLINPRQHIMTLPDGRQLCWFESGPKTGFPVIFCTGAGMSGNLGFGLDLLEKYNIRLIVPERAGLGDSTFHAHKSLKSVALDIQALLDNQGIKQFSVLGFSQGGVFAMAVAHYCQPVSLSIVSGQDQFEHPATRAKLTADVVNLQEQALNTPENLSDWLQKNVTGEWLLAFILNCSAEIDQQLYNEEHFLEAYTDCMCRAFSQGNQGYVQDLLLSLQNWEFNPEDITCPTALWYGELDMSTVHSPDFGDVLADRFFNCNHHLYTQEGGSLLWTQADAILTDLQNHAA